jgi:hypothetical protein
MVRLFSQRHEFRLGDVMKDAKIKVPHDLYALWRVYRNKEVSSESYWSQNAKTELLLGYNFIINSNVPLVLTSPTTSM